jgi:hypothetical protein
MLIQKIFKILPIAITIKVILLLRTQPYPRHRQKKSIQSALKEKEIRFGFALAAAVKAIEVSYQT